MRTSQHCVYDNVSSTGSIWNNASLQTQRSLSAHDRSTPHFRGLRRRHAPFLDRPHRTSSHFSTVGEVACRIDRPRRKGHHARKPHRRSRDVIPRGTGLRESGSGDQKDRCAAVSGCPPEAAAHRPLSASAFELIPDGFLHGNRTLIEPRPSPFFRRRVSRRRSRQRR